MYLIIPLKQLPFTVLHSVKKYFCIAQGHVFFLNFDDVFTLTLFLACALIYFILRNRIFC